MKVLIVNKFLHPNGGSETYIFGLGKALQELGHKVQFFGMEHEGRCVGNAVNSYTSDMDFHNVGALKKLSYSLKTIYSVEARKKIRLVLDDFKPDIVHLNNFNYQLTPAIILEIVKWRKQSNKECKIFYTAHDYQLLCPNHMFNNPATHENCEKCLGGHFGYCVKGRCVHGSLAKSVVGTAEAYFWKNNGVYRYIDRIICCSQFMKKKLDTNPVFTNKTVAVHNFVDKPVQYECEISDVLSGFGVKMPYVLYFGRFSWEKGIRTLIAACKSLPEVNFVFAGKGEYAKEIDRIPNAINVGFRSGKELDALIRGAMFSVVPSEWYENNPFSLTESQQRLVPVLGADIGGIPELIEEGKTGWLFRSGDVNDLIGHIRLVYSNPELVDKCREGLNAVQRDDASMYAKRIYEDTVFTKLES